MKVGLVCPYSLSWPGGVQGHVLSLSSHLRDLGCDTRVIAPCDATPPATEVLATGPSRPFDANGSIARLGLSPRTFLRVGRILAEEQFDLLHIHEPFQASTSIFALLHAGRIPVVGTFHAAATELEHYERLRPVLTPLWKRISLHAAVSPAAAALAQKYFGGEYRILPNGVDVALFASGHTCERDPSETVVLFIGRLEPRKGCDVLINAFAHLTRRIDRARLWVIGDGPQAEALRRQAHELGIDRVDFFGAVTGSELRGRLRAADIFCSPAVEGESFGIVLLEAMASGTPVVASDLPGYASVASGAASLVRTGIPEALAAAIGDLALDATLQKERIEAGRSRANEYSWKRLSRNVLATYEEVLEDSTRGGAHAA